MQKFKFKNQLLLIFIGIILLLPYLGEFHLFDWDELNFAEAAREMLVTGDYLTVRIDYRPFHEKPPLFFWMQAASMHVFGINEFAARLPNALTGILTMLFVYSIGKKLLDEKLGLLWALAYIGSFLPHFYFRTGIIDPVFNFFIFTGIYYIYKYLNFVKSCVEGHSAGKRLKYLLFAGFFISIAVLTKGPVAFLLAFLVVAVMWFIIRYNFRKIIFDALFFGAVSLFPFFVWYSFVFFNNSGTEITNLFESFIMYHLRLLLTPDAGFGGPFYYHFIILFVGCFPSSVLMLRGVLTNGYDLFHQNLFRKTMLCLLFVVLIVFSIVNTKIIHYSSLAYFPITFFAANGMYRIIYRALQWKKTSSWLLGILGCFWGAALFFIPFFLLKIDFFIKYINEQFTREVLMSNVEWNYSYLLVGSVYIATVVFSLFVFKYKKYLQGFLLIYGMTALTVFSALNFLAPKLEEYVQGAAIEFYKSKKGEACYIDFIHLPNFRYGHLFYSQKPPELAEINNPSLPKGNYSEWLLQGKLDKTAYFITKNKDLNKLLSANGKLKHLYSKNGLAFLKREAEQ